MQNTRQQHPAPAANLLQHLRNEEQLLADAITVANEVYAALVHGDLATASTFAAEQQQIALALEDMGEARTVAASAFAESRDIHVEGNLTLAILAADAPDPIRQELFSARIRLTTLTAALTAIQTRNANLLGHLRSFFRGVIADITAAETPARYGPSGSRLAPASGVALLACG